MKLASGVAIAQLITALAAPILSRLFSPSSYGTFTVFVSLVSVVSVIVCLRYELAIMLPERGEEAINVLGVAVGAGVFVTAVGTIVALSAADPLPRLLNSPELARYLWLAPVGLLVQAAFQVASQWNTRMKRFDLLSVARVFAAAATSVLSIGLAMVGQATAGALIAAWLAGAAVLTIVLSRQVAGDARRLLPAVELSSLLGAAKRYRKFPLVDSWGGLLNSFSWQLPGLMLSAFFSQAVVGHYSLSSRILLAPLTVVGGAVSRVFFQRASELRSRPDQLAHVVKQNLEGLIALGLLPSLLLAVLGQELFTLVFGPEWTEAGLYAQILSPWMFFLFVSSPLSSLFLVLERQELALVVHSIILVTRVAALLVGGLLDSVYLALGLWSGTGALVYGGLAIWNMKLGKVSLRVAGRILLRYGSYAFPAVAVLLGLKLWLEASPWLMLVVAAAMLVAYGLLVLRRNRALYSYLTSVAELKPEWKHVVKCTLRGKGD